MHEVSLNRLITDYITGESIEDTTYEDLRQALARMLVEDKKYPRASVRPKYPVSYLIDAAPQTATIDLAVFGSEDRPLLALFFCPGETGTFIRESVAAARIHTPQPFPLVAVTDSMSLILVNVSTAEPIDQGFGALPPWHLLVSLAETYPAPVLSAERRAKEERILHAYRGLGGPCCGGECAS
ncbi:type I restriction enzyme HsdR N-terminal domain-containing protein [Desulfovibrionales bacterium]